MKIRSHITRIVLLVIGFLLGSILMGVGLPVRADGVTAQFRVTQLTQRTIVDGPSDKEVDIYMDGVQVVPWKGIAFPFATDYLSFPAGKHTITVVMAGETPDMGQSVDMDLVAGHRHNLIVFGDFALKSEGLTQISIDETALLAYNDIAKDACALILVNLTESTRPLEISIDGKRGVEVPSGHPVALAVPLTRFHVRVTSPEMPGKLIQDDDWIGLPTTVVTIVAWNRPPTITTRYFYVSDLKIGEWLMAAGTALITESPSGLSIIFQALKAMGLDKELNGSPFTVFVPLDSDKFLEAMAASQQAGKTGPRLIDIVNNHIVPGRYTPNDLRRLKQIKTLQGSVLTFDFDSIQSGMWEINGHIPVWLDIRLANGVVYTIYDILMPKP